MKPIEFYFSQIIRIETLILMAIIIFIFYQNIKSNPTIKTMISLATTVKTETFTELYFENHTELPEKIVSGQLYPFSFTIHNLENNDMLYPYTVSLQREGVNLVVEEGIVDLKSNQYMTVETVIGPLSDIPKKVVVELTDKNQIISFWMGKQYE
ncbi:hypothetical protein KKE45_02720 [Patescibacteria group bacterium]|nr:hypothetical protein [Patescibacteria group bacterium]